MRKAQLRTRLRVFFNKIDHIFEISKGESLHVRKAAFQVFGQILNCLGS
ncbi:MAG: hypothetical protein RLZZ453_104 [Chlamydiota bacterium]|jgi:hypothetical protein